MFCSFVKVDEIFASSRETFACFMSQDTHTGQLISTVYGTLKFAVDMTFLDISQRGTRAPDNHSSMLNCRFGVFIQHRVFLPQNAGKTRDKLPYRELSCLKWRLNFCGLVDGLLLCFSGRQSYVVVHFDCLQGTNFAVFQVFAVFHRWGPGPLYKRSSRLKS